MDENMKAKVLTDELKKQFPYGIKAYGEWHLFNAKTTYKEYLNEWIANTDGSEQSRAVDALVSVDSEPHYDSDAN